MTKASIGDYSRDCRNGSLYKLQRDPPEAWGSPCNLSPDHSLTVKPCPFSIWEILTVFHVGPLGIRTLSWIPHELYAPPPHSSPTCAYAYLKKWVLLIIQESPRKEADLCKTPIVDC